MSVRVYAPGKITVVTPTIPPRAVLLARSRESVKRQKRPPDDHVIAMDWAGDGPGAMRNAALARVTSEWTAFLDDDDEFMPHHLRACEKWAAMTGADLIYPLGRYTALGDDPLHQAGVAFNPIRLRMGNFIPITVFVRTALVHDVGGFPTGRDVPLMGRQRCEDWGLWLRLLDAGAAFAPLHQITWICHSHAGIHGNTSGEAWTDHERAVQASTR